MSSFRFGEYITLDTPMCVSFPETKAGGGRGVGCMHNDQVQAAIQHIACMLELRSTFPPGMLEGLEHREDCAQGGRNNQSLPLIYHVPGILGPRNMQLTNNAVSTVTESNSKTASLTNGVPRNLHVMIAVNP